MLGLNRVQDLWCGVTHKHFPRWFLNFRLGQVNGEHGLCGSCLLSYGGSTSERSGKALLSRVPPYSLLNGLMPP
jgi:hypothetical protein